MLVKGLSNLWKLFVLSRVWVCWCVFSLVKLCSVSRWVMLVMVSFF